MTLCELLHKVTWEEVRPYIEQHLAECPGMKLSDYERMFERLRRMAPERWVVPGLFRFYISPDTPYSREWKDIAHDTISATGYYVTDHAFGVPWAVALATRIEQWGDLYLSDAQWAAYCLWEMSREKIEREIPKSMHCFRNKNKPLLLLRLGWLLTDYRINRQYKHLSTPIPSMDSDLYLPCRARHLYAQELFDSRPAAHERFQVRGKGNASAHVDQSGSRWNDEKQTSV